MFYGFSFDGDEAHCREEYEDADALLSHLDNGGALLEEALKIADLTRLEVHAAIGADPGSETAAQWNQLWLVRGTWRPMKLVMT